MERKTNKEWIETLPEPKRSELLATAIPEILTFYSSSLNQALSDFGIDAKDREEILATQPKSESQQQEQQQEQKQRDIEGLNRLVSECAVELMEGFLKKGEVEATATITVSVKVHLAMPQNNQ